MNPQRLEEIDQIFQSALDLAPENRAVFLDRQCGADAELRAEVESLLNAHDKAGGFIQDSASDVAASLLEKNRRPPAQVGQYTIKDVLGVGGMAEVYLATDRLGRQVALKLLVPRGEKDQQRLARFQQEARTLLALNHPNIVTIYDIGETDGTYYIASELIEGQSLRQRLAAGELDLAGVLEILIQVTTALTAAHEKGIVHRDIKPENVMIRGDGYVKVLDFGIAKLTEEFASPTNQDAATRLRVRTAEGIVIGTALYMSPEQARGQAVDARTDVWSCGAMLYEMLTGQSPFSGGTAAEIIAHILDREPPPLARYTTDPPAELQRIVSKALTKDREARYQTAKDLLIDLRNLKRKLELDAEIDRTLPPELRLATSTGGPQVPASSSGEVATHAASSAEYIVTGVKRHRLAAVIALLVLIAGGTGLWAYFHSRGSEVAIESIAVLPFQNQNNDPNTEYLSDGIPESIINSLSQLPNLKVMSRNSVFHYKGKQKDAQAVANELKVQAVLTGRVAQRGDGLWISVELIDARDNSQIWGQQYNRKLADVFAVQEEMATEISERLRSKLTGSQKQQLAKRPTENLKAFQYYIQGRSYAHRRTREDLLMAISYYEKAIEEDRNYALAYTGLADTYGSLGTRGYIAPIEGRRKTEEAALQALTLDENLAEAHVALGQVYVQYTPSNFSIGDRELRRAIELSSSLAMAHLHLGISLVRQGRLDEGLAELLKARELDPLSSVVARLAASGYYYKRDYVRALELLRQANELGPPFSTSWEIEAYIRNRLFDEALAELAKAKRERKNDSLLICSTGMIYAAQGKRAEALEIIKELEEMSGASLSAAQMIARIYATLNEKGLALTWLERGLATGAMGPFFKDDPVWDPIHSDPRFADLLRRAGFTQ